MIRELGIVLCIAVAGFVFAAAVVSATDPSAAAATETTGPTVHTVTATETLPPTFQGRSARWWAHRTTYWKREAINRGRVLRARGNVTEAINLACTIYGNCATLWRKAGCETGGTYSPYAANRHSSARGLFQFLTTPRGGTWATTPFVRFSVYSPYANALAAGWMHVHGRGGEWSCR